MAKLRVTKRHRSIGTRIDSLAQVPAKIDLWRRRMKSSVYKSVFWPALWGEAGEYEVRGSIGSGAFYLFLGIAGLIFMADVRYRGWVRVAFLAAFVAFIIIGLRQFADLQGPIWWADRFAVRARESYLARGTYQRYTRFSSLYQNPGRTAPPLKLEEIAYLAELYHQQCTGTISGESLEQLGTYSVAEVNYFYRMFDVRTTDPVFPAQYIGRYVRS